MTKLTNNQVTVLRTVLKKSKGGDADYIQNGEIGMWFDDLVIDSVENGLKDKKQARVTVNQLIKKGIFRADTTVEEGSTWLEMPDAGKEALTEALFANDPEELERQKAHLASLEQTDEDVDDLVGDIRADVMEGTPEDEVEDAIAEIEAEDEDEDLVGTVETTHTENYTVREWTDADDVEWTEITFGDKSRVIKRRKKVSGSWRTDYWGAEFEGDKETYTTAKRFKMAKAYGSFTHTDK